MAAAPSENVTVQIMGRSYAFACAPDEKQSLLESVALVDAKMNAIRGLGKLSGVDRIAVMAALTLANDLVAERSVKRPVTNVSHPIDIESSIGLEIESVRSRMELTSEAIERFLERVRPQFSSKQDDLFG